MPRRLNRPPRRTPATARDLIDRLRASSGLAEIIAAFETDASQPFALYHQSSGAEWHRVAPRECDPALATLEGPSIDRDAAGPAPCRLVRLDATSTWAIAVRDDETACADDIADVLSWRLGSWQATEAVRLSDALVHAREGHSDSIVESLDAMLGVVCAWLGVARVTLSVKAARRPLPVVAVGSRPGANGAFPGTPVSTRRTERRSWATGSAAIELDVHVEPGDAFPLAESLDDVVRALRPWLAGALAGLAHASRWPTSLLDSDQLAERAAVELERARRFGARCGVLLIGSMQDLALRHELALADLAGTVRAQLRPPDLLGRSTDGMLVALVVAADAPTLDAIAARVRQALESQDPPQRATARIATALFPEDGAGLADLLASARRYFLPQQPSLPNLASPTSPAA